MDSTELRDTFDRVNAYRFVTAQVRATAGRTLFNGAFMLVIAYLLWSISNGEISIFLVSYTLLGLLEVAVGLWKRFAPSVECLLADAFVNGLFGGSVLARQFLIWQGMLVGHIQPFSIIIGVWALFDAYQSLMAYFNLRKAFVERPTRTQMRYVADMLADIRDGDPEEDGTILDFSRELDFKAQLLGDHVFILDRHGNTGVLQPQDLVIHKNGDGQFGHVVLSGQQLPPVPVSPANWRNYCQWKGIPEA